MTLSVVIGAVLLVLVLFGLVLFLKNAYGEWRPAILTLLAAAAITGVIIAMTMMLTGTITF